MRKWIVSLFLVVGALAVEGAVSWPMEDISKIVIQAGGRKKPLDTFASESLQSISGRRSFKDAQTGEKMGAVEAILSMWFKAREWKSLPMILVSDPALRRELGLNASERHFALDVLDGNAVLQEFSKTIQSKRARNLELADLEKEAEMVLIRSQQLGSILTGEALAIVPNPEKASGQWLLLSEVRQVYDETAAAKLNQLFNELSMAYGKDQAGIFGAKAREFRKALAELAPAYYPQDQTVDLEVHYNQLHPFRWAWVLYLAAFFLLLGSRDERLGLSIFTAGLVAHIYGLVLRCLIAGRAPVTNMYESVIWVTLGICFFAFVFRWIYHAKIYVLASAPLGIAGLILADILPAVLNPNIGPLPPVLRDNFWLVTHVLTITLGYAAFALAMGLAHVILGGYLFKPASMDERSAVHQLLYRVLQLGVLLLAAGTILGGLWAHYSWGRFWGWDPKETWAFIALLIYIFALHGRMAGWWGNFGLSVAAVVGFAGVLMAWYGVNFVLGKGLHSYGFGGGGAIWVGLLVALDLLFVGLCMAVRIRHVRQTQDALEDHLLRIGKTNL